MEREDAIRPRSVAGLRNAHAMEHQRLSFMDRQIDRLLKEAYDDEVALAALSDESLPLVVGEYLERRTAAFRASY